MKLNTRGMTGMEGAGIRVSMVMLCLYGESLELSQTSIYENSAKYNWEHAKVESWFLQLGSLY